MSQVRLRMMNCDDDVFEDLLASDDMLEFSSQETLHSSTADHFCLSKDDLLFETLSDMSGVESFDELNVVDHLGSSIVGLPQAAPGALLPPTRQIQRDKLHPEKARSSKKQKASSFSHPNGSPRQWIEAIFRQILNDLDDGEAEIGISLNLRSRQPLRSQAVLTGDSSDTRVRSKRLSFPGKTEDVAWRFTIVMRILELIHSSLCTGITISKRDIYYRDPALFGNQRHVDRYVDDIAFTFGVPRSALNVTAMAKGLVAGAVSFSRRDGSTVTTSADREGLLVPSLKDILSVDLTSAKWVIVIEKEASFRSSAASSFWDRLSSEGVLITGKGYPDLATRALLHCFCTPSPQNGFASPPCFALVDYDPDGLAIMSVYKHGSIALAHESAELKVPQLRWLGLRNEHMTFTATDAHASQALLTLSTRDRAKARRMLERGTDPIDGPPTEGDEVSAALRVMLMLNIKAELQLLDAVPGGMAQLLHNELNRLAPSSAE
ncbi:endodeoxyribonuclease [Recurvomyces mirabilis]|nr:endodeoxyribonuclease [Recurvomyces mirabilis]